MNGKSLLEMEKVTYYYTTKAGKVDILEQADYAFEAGRMYVIMGPSGVGKTTTLALLGALDSPVEGKILFGQNDIQKIGYEKYRSKNIGLIFQAYNLFNYLTARENVEVSMEIAGDKKNKKERAETLLERLGLKKEQFSRKPGQLSGGEQQRVAIARALAANADVLLADEPTGNLDADTAAEIGDIFAEVAHGMGKCVIIVTHSEKLAEKADEIVILENRKLVMKI